MLSEGGQHCSAGGTNFCTRCYFVFYNVERVNDGACLICDLKVFPSFLGSLCAGPALHQRSRPAAHFGTVPAKWTAGHSQSQWHHSLWLTYGLKWCCCLWRRGLHFCWTSVHVSWNHSGRQENHKHDRTAEQVLQTEMRWNSCSCAEGRLHFFWDGFPHGSSSCFTHSQRLTKTFSFCDSDLNLEMCEMLCWKLCNKVFFIRSHKESERLYKPNSCHIQWATSLYIMIKRQEINH